MGKKPVSFMAMVGMLAGGSAPMLFGDMSLLDGWGLLGGLVGGLLGVWLGVILVKRFS